MPITLTKKVELYDNNSGRIKRFTVADGTQISKGLILKLTDPNTASVADALSHALAVASAGVSSTEKEANDGQIEIGCWTQGKMNSVCSGTIVTGNSVVAIQNGKIEVAFHLASGAQIIGHALEDGTDNESIDWILNL